MILFFLNGDYTKNFGFTSNDADKTFLVIQGLFNGSWHNSLIALQKAYEKLCCMFVHSVLNLFSFSPILFLLTSCGSLNFLFSSSARKENATLMNLTTSKPYYDEICKCCNFAHITLDCPCMSTLSGPVCLPRHARKNI